MASFSSREQKKLDAILARIQESEDHGVSSSPGTTIIRPRSNLLSVIQLPVEEGDESEEWASEPEVEEEPKLGVLVRKKRKYTKRKKYTRKAKVKADKKKGKKKKEKPIKVKKRGPGRPRKRKRESEGSASDSGVEGIVELKDSPKKRKKRKYTRRKVKPKKKIVVSPGPIKTRMARKKKRGPGRPRKVKIVESPDEMEYVDEAFEKDDIPLSDDDEPFDIKKATRKETFDFLTDKMFSYKDSQQFPKKLMDSLLTLY